MTTVPPLIIDELADAIAGTIEIATPAFSQVGMSRLLVAFTRLINHHANIVPTPAAPAGPTGANPAPILPPPPVVIPNQ